MGRLIAAVVLLLALLAAPGPAGASQLIARDVTGVSLAVDASGLALVRYQTAGGKAVKVVAWGAIDALRPSQGADQVRFRLDYSGGTKQLGRPVWKTHVNGCRAYDGPPLPWFVGGCRAPDGTLWAVQAWQRALPSFGREPTTGVQRAVELRLSHWSGPVPLLEVWQDWKFSSRLGRVFGRYTYAGEPVYGFAATPTGVPLDRFGRNVYLDALDSAYGSGWRRANGFLTHRPTGAFCALVASRALASTHASGWGTRLRLTVLGPGVTPDVGWEDAALPRFDAADARLVEHGRAMDDVVVSLGDAACTP